MEALFLSTAAVAVAEIGDKTQLLALLLAARFRKPVPIIAGIFLATIANHGLAAWIGQAAAHWVSGPWLRWGLGLSFLAMAAWIMVPDKMDEEPGLSDRFGPFLATLMAFFLVEIGDKTQVATVALAARYQDLLLVTCGTTVGMMLANVPAVLLGDVAATRLPLKLIHGIAALIFAIMGVMILLNVGQMIGE